MCVPSIMPTTLNKPIKSQNLWIVLAILCHVGAWIYFPSNPSLEESTLQIISV